jgi:photosynthetic reaction center cytochrome c subunit
MRMISAVAALTVVWLVGVVLAASGTTIAPHSMASDSQSTDRTRREAEVLPIFGAHGFALAGGQTGAQSRLRMAEEVFKDIQVLKGTSVDDFLGTMGLMAAALGFDCSDCHTGAGTDTVKWELDTPNKRTARRMTQMVAAINRDNFGGRQGVTCWTCHRGRDRPLLTPDLDYVYGTLIPVPDDILTAVAGVPSVDQVFDKYVQAIGGTERLAGLTSYAAKATSVGFGNLPGGFGGGGQVEIFAKAPDRRATYIHYADPERGDQVHTFDGSAGWIATPLAVVREFPLTGGELDGARLEAQLSFPGQIKQVLSNWRVSAPTTINGRNAQVVQGNGPRGLIATLYFDDESGQLVRLLRWSPSPIGRVPTRIDYADYREVGGSGIKMPFRWTSTWLDGRDTFELREVQLNVSIDAAKFGQP